MYQVNPNAKHGYFTVGNEKTPIYVIDNFLLDLTECKRYAIENAFLKPDKNSSYPGNRSILDNNYTATVIKTVQPILHNFFGIYKNLNMDIVADVYSILSKRENQLTPFQCIPHCDTFSPNAFAVMHYINSGDFGGTGFYRHKPTGFENITANRLNEYNDSVQQYLDTYGYPQQLYFKDSDSHFELIGKVAYVPNRLLIYPGSLLHSAYVSEDKDVIADVKKGRLTTNIFIDFSEKVSFR